MTPPRPASPPLHQGQGEEVNRMDAKQALLNLRLNESKMTITPAVDDID